MAIEFGNSAAGTFPAARPLRASGNVALLAPKFFLGCAEPSRIVYDFGITGYREGFQANVDANGIVVLRQRFAIQDRGKAGVPLGAKFLPQAVRGNPLEVLNQPMDTQLRVYFYQHVYVVGHDFQSHDFGTIFVCHLSKRLFAPFSAGSDQHSSPILRRPHNTQWYLLE